jgi:hypothetical protein
MSLGEKNLIELAKHVFSEKYDFVKGPVNYKGKSGKAWTFDAVVKNKMNTFGVFIRDWKREISITQLRQLHKACIDTNIQGGIMVCNVITDFSREYSSQFGIQLLSRGHLISTLRRRRFQNDF